METKPTCILLLKYDVNIPALVRAIKYGRPYSRFKPTQFALDLYDEAIDSRYQAYWRDTWYAIIDAENIAIGDTAFYLPKKMWNKDQIDRKNIWYSILNLVKVLEVLTLK